jgi:hypothetical protein
MKQFIIRCGLVVTCILAGCGGEEGVEEVKEEWGQEEPEDSPVTAMHVPVEQRDSFFLPFEHHGLTSRPLSELGRGPIIGRRVIRIRVARPRRTPLNTQTPSKKELNNLDLGNLLGNQFPGMGRDLDSFSPPTGQPAPSGDVGPTDTGSIYYVQAVNDSLAVFDTATGTAMVRPLLAQRLWAGTPCSTAALSDGAVRYDALGERWIITYHGIVNGSSSMNQEPRDALGAVEPASTADRAPELHAMWENRNRYYQCVAVSATPDPTGFYHRYVATFDGFNDVPKLGVWPDGYYLTTTMSSSPDEGTPRRARVCAMEREQMLLGRDARMLCFDVATHAMHYVDLLPADLDVEKTPGVPPTGTPPPGSPLHVFSLRQTQPRVPMTSRTYDFFNRIGVWKFHVDWAAPDPRVSSTLLGPYELRVERFQMGFEVPQRGSSVRLDPLDYKLVGRAPYRNFVSRQAILLTHAVPRLAGGAVVPGSGLRWYELELPADPLSGWPTVAQYGTYAPDAHYRWLGSIAFDKLGNIALAFTISSSSLYPSLRYTGRTTNCDTPPPTGTRGTMSRRERTLKAGRVSERSSPMWGTSSTLNVGPDGCTFWYTAEYRGPGGAAERAWSTHIGAFRLPGCDSPAPGSCTPFP